MSVLGPINPAETLDREALAKVVDGLERTTRAALSLELDHPLLETTTDEVRLEGDREEWQATLETCRQTFELLGGTKARVFRRWVAIGLPAFHPASGSSGRPLPADDRVAGLHARRRR
jgi:hypothetical protein